MSTATTATIEQLSEAVSDMDRRSQTTFGEIATVAKLALERLETPNCLRDTETLATVLSLIWNKALDAQNYINCEAERVGCNYQDQAQRKRYEAFRIASAIARGEVKP